MTQVSHWESIKPLDETGIQNAKGHPESQPQYLYSAQTKRS